MAENSQGYGYGTKRPIWQWIAIYAVIGIVVYGLIYYFFFAKKSGNIYAPTPATTNTQTTPAVSNSQDTVTLTSTGFQPASLTVKAGTKVTWVNQSGVDAAVNSAPHPIHTDYAPLNLGTFLNGGTLNLTFDKAGTYKYHNHLNPSQTGTIIVQ